MTTTVETSDKAQTSLSLDGIDADQAGEVVEAVRQQVPALNKVPKPEMVKAIRFAMSFSGPLPPPAFLKHYNDIIPNGGERIVAMAEAEQKHDHEMQARDMRLREQQQDQADNALLGDQLYRFWGLVLGFVALVFLNGCVVYLIETDHSITGGIIGGTEIIGAVALFVTGKSRMSQPDEAPKHAANSSHSKTKKSRKPLRKR